MVHLKFVRSFTLALDNFVSYDLLDERSAAKAIDVAPNTLAVWRSTGRYRLPFIKVGRKVRYRREDLVVWLAERTRAAGTTAEGGNHGL